MSERGSLRSEEIKLAGRARECSNKVDHFLSLGKTHLFPSRQKQIRSKHPFEGLHKNKTPKFSVIVIASLCIDFVCLCGDFAFYGCFASLCCLFVVVLHLWQLL